jgi:hypothetical protein
MEGSPTMGLEVNAFVKMVGKEVKNKMLFQWQEGL